MEFLEAADFAVDCFFVAAAFGLAEEFLAVVVMILFFGLPAVGLAAFLELIGAAVAEFFEAFEVAVAVLVNFVVVVGFVELLV